MKKNQATVLPVKQFITTDKRPQRSKNVSTRKRCVERLLKRYMFHLRRVKSIFTNRKGTEEDDKEEELI